MKTDIAPARPGLAAIAAVIAFLPLAAAAQTADPPVGETAAPTQPATPVLVPPTPPIQTVQSLPPPLPKLPDLAVLTEPKRSAHNVRSAAAQQPNGTKKSAAPDISGAAKNGGSAIKSTPKSAEPAVAQPASLATQIARGAYTGAVPVRPPAPASADVHARADSSAPLHAQAPTGSADESYWLLLGGGLLIAVGAALTLTERRRRSVDRAVEGHESGSGPLLPTAVQAPTSAAVPARGTVATSAYRDQLEALVSAAPTVENPFLTRRNRLRRANFLLRTGAVGQGMATSDKPQSVVAPPPHDRWATLSFGGHRAVPFAWRPAKSRST